MQQILTVLLFWASFSTQILAQKFEKVELKFSGPFQLDSSEYFLIPKFIDNADLYGKGKGYLPWGSYSEILVYNSKTDQTKKLLNGKLALIQPFSFITYHAGGPREDTPPNFLPNHIIYLARIDNFSGDNALDDDDPLYLFISTKTGDGLRQITPKGLNVVSWVISKNKEMIIVKVQNDKNGNKKFGIGDEELFYRFDLNADISKIQCNQVNL